ncbi:MAG: tetraacyldisaccharide 4'-kinase [Thiobacillus sp.]|uniref:tetraacyldisaccharide 4'-kinase n=1 Tax=Thiobacillus sp. TaxID=924 RepID=UPI002732CCC4|nr:tetraacyldisaccharide 4'-kinase [Thiobacillus sp.]MDP3584218.1 tetraacyldisaccharide 4'-kinase [Thiobacillus sp.]
MNAATESALRQAWLARGPLTRLLYPLSLVYRALFAARRLLFAWGWRRATRLPVPVVVVGNVVVGGAGKTPTTIAVVRHLLAQGWHPGVVSRGHGRQQDGVLAVGASSDPADTGDEPLLIQRATGVPVWVAKQRATAGLALLKAHPAVDVIVCDDGLQHLALARDLEVVVFDDRGLGNGWCLPAGLLREPWPRRSDAPALVLHQQRQPAPPFFPGFVARRALADEAVNAQGRATPLAELANNAAPLCALAGIARPEVFFDMLAERGLRLAHAWPLPDHADLAALWPDLLAQCPPGATVLCTEKDAVKLWPLLTGTSPQVLAVPLMLTPEPAFFHALDARLSSRHGPQTP